MYKKVQGSGILVNQSVFPFAGGHTRNRDPKFGVRIVSITSPNDISHINYGGRSGNSAFETLGFQLLECETFTYPTKHMEITDVFKVHNGALVPIFYVHVASGDAAGIRLVDGAGREHPHYPDPCNNALYVTEKGRYIVEWTDNQSNVHRELLNARPVWREATAKDLTSSFDLDHYRKVYLAERDGDIYRFRLSRYAKIAVRPKHPQRTFLDYVAKPIGSPHYPVFRCEDFEHYVDGTPYKYRFPELRDQAFMPTYPYLKIGPDNVRYSGNIVYFSNPIAVTGSGLYTDIYVMDGDRVVASYSDNPARIDEEGCGEVLNVSHWGAIISSPIAPGLQVSAVYYIDASAHYLYPLDLNPVTNSYMANRIVLFYARPCMREQGLYHICFSMDGSVPSDMPNSMISNDPDNHKEGPHANRLDNPIIDDIVIHLGYDTSYEYCVDKFGGIGS